MEPLSNYLVGRITKEMSDGNTIAGAMFTASNRAIDDPALSFLSRNAYAGGIDFSHFLAGKKYQIEFKLAGSHVQGDLPAMLRLQNNSSRYYQRPDAAHIGIDSTLTVLNGHGGEIEFSKGSYGHWRYGAELSWKSPGLEFNDLGYLRSADEILGELKLSYVESAPGTLFNRYSITVGTEKRWDFNRTPLAQEGDLGGEFVFKNRWRVFGGAERSGAVLDTRLLRGGPALRLRGYWGFNLGAASDPGRNFQADFHFYTHSFDDGYSASQGLTPGLSYKITEALQFASSLGISREKELFHFMGAPVWQSRPRYLLAALDRKTLEMTLRFDYAISPELTIQYYGSPYLSFGTYSNWCRVADPSAREYEQMAPQLQGRELSFDMDSRILKIDEDGDALSDYSVELPDFSFREFRSNLVLRWEVRTGSTLYLVWSHDRSSYQNSGRRDWGHNWNELLDAPGGNVFLAKFSYWFAI